MTMVADIPTIYSSTNLDTWSLLQLRTLKVGGNASLADFLSKHGASSLLPPGNHDARARYTSRQAGLYKEELIRRIDADTQRFVFSLFRLLSFFMLINCLAGILMVFM
jgi:hypothetical protein